MSEYYTTAQLRVRYCGCAKTTIYRKIRELGFPQPVQFGNRNLFLRSAVHAWEAIHMPAAGKPTIELPAVELPLSRQDAQQLSIDKLVTLSIEARMRELNFTPAVLAEKAGITKATVYYILSGRNAPRGSTLDAIVRALGCTQLDLVKFRQV